MNCSIGDLIWIPDQTVGVKPDTINHAQSSAPVTFLKGPIYGLVMRQPTNQDIIDPDRKWIKACFKHDGTQKEFFVQKRDVRVHTEITND